MPYIKKQDRKKFDLIIKNLVEILKKEPIEKQDGDINYITSKILLETYQPQRYFNFNRAMGVLESIKQEFYRRFIAPYEDKKIQENGDIRDDF